MRRAGLALLFCCLLTVSVVHAGSEVLSGEVEGVWAAGSIQTIGDYAYVPSGKSLLVQEGVVIVFLTVEAFDIFGSFDAMGTADEPIVVTAPNNWGGFYFSGDGDRTDTLRYVIVLEEDGLPRHVVRSHGQSLVVAYCDFKASQSCLEISNAHLWAMGNTFLTRGLFSRTVKLESLVPVIDFPPGTAPQNCLRNSLIKADVPSVPVSPFEWRFTTALEVQSSNETVLRDNTFSVVAPGYACGVFFGETEGASAVGARIQHCPVTVWSHNVQARGVVNAREGDLEIWQCTIDVGGGQYSPIGVSASNRAQSYVNSCNITLTTGRLYCVAELGANVTVMYADLWVAAAALSVPEQMAPPFEGKFSADFGVSLGEGVFSADPMYARGSEWGEWPNLESVRAYYSLLPTSPCIDRGDVGLGLDPDNTRPDVGCFYFPQELATPERPLPSPISMLLAPYPNPFNSAAVIPFVVGREGEVRVTVFDVLGRPVADLTAGRFAVGEHTVPVHAGGWATGLYFVTMDFEGVRTGTQKLLLVR